MSKFRNRFLQSHTNSLLNMCEDIHKKKIFFVKLVIWYQINKNKNLRLNNKKIKLNQRVSLKKKLK